MDTSNSAGGIVVNARGEIVLVEHGSSWSLPKGTLQSGETPLAAAQRDVERETGLADLHYEGALPAYELPAPVDATDIVHVYPFLFTTASTELAPPDAAGGRADWKTLEDVIPLLRDDNDRALIDAARGRIEALATRLRGASLAD